MRYGSKNQPNQANRIGQTVTFRTNAPAGPARWKRIGARRGQTGTYYFPTAGEAIKEALHLVELRRRRGYAITRR